MTNPPQFGRRGLSTPTVNTAFVNIPPKRRPELNSNPFDIVQFLFGFDGRISRLQFWLGGTLFITTAVAMAFTAYGLKDGAGNGFLGQIFTLILAVLVIWTGLAIEMKRWHDRGKSGLWVLLPLVPIAGPIWAFIELGVCVGTLGPNAYGPAPMGMSGGAYEEFASVFS